MRKELKKRVFAIAVVCVLCLSETGKGLPMVYADTEDVEAEDVIFEEGYVSEDGKWNCTLVKHENVSRTTSVTLPRTVISIGDEAFSWMPR